jgi:hypothetical protein
MATQMGRIVGITLLLLAVLSSKLDAADSYRLRADHDNATGWGNCIPVSSECCITAAHCVEEGVVSVEINRAWVKADVLATDKDNDLALIRVPHQEFKAVELGVFPLVVKAAGAELSAEGNPQHSQIKIHVGVPERLVIRFDGMKCGMSGSPVLVGGRLVAMISNGIPSDGQQYPIKPTDLKFDGMNTIPASIIKEFIDKHEGELVAK